MHKDMKIETEDHILVLFQTGVTKRFLRTPDRILYSISKQRMSHGSTDAYPEVQSESI